MPDDTILVTGSLAFDNIMDFPGYFKDHILPEKIHVINISFLVGKLERQRGGCAGNIAYTLALLGSRPRIVAAAGNDFDEYRGFLDEKGVDTSAIRAWDDEITASCFVTTDKADSQINGFYPGAMKHAGELSLAAAADGAIAAIVSPDDPGAIIRHCREARQAGLPFFFDPSFQVTAMEGEDLAEAVDGAVALLLNDYEYAVFLDKTGLDEKALLERIQMVVVTLGEQGSRVTTREGAMHEIPAVPISEVVDPTGAGDAFRGGFLHGWAHGLDPEACARLGSVAGAYAVERYGTQRHSYTAEEFRQRYEAAFGAFPIASKAGAA